jgi:hypothetical protein
VRFFAVVGAVGGGGCRHYRCRHISVGIEKGIDTFESGSAGVEQTYYLITPFWYIPECFIAMLKY